MKEIKFDLRSMKRATFLVTEPGRGRSLHQENPGAVDQKLRNAIKAARRAFDRAMKKPE